MWWSHVGGEGREDDLLTWSTIWILVLLQFMVPVPFRALHNTKNSVLTLWPKLFFSICTLMDVFHFKKTCMSEAVKILARRFHDLVPRAEEDTSLFLVQSCFSKQSKKEKYNQTNSFHCALYSYPPLEHKSLFSHGFTKQSTLQQCWLTLFLLPSCEFNQRIDLTSEKSGTNALVFS